MSNKIHSLITAIAFLMIGLSLVSAVTLTTSRIVRADPGVLYAAPAAQGSGDCFSWATACTLQTALTQAVSGDEIWVKAGVHMPTSDPADRTASFNLRTGVALYGGFAGTETIRDQRNWSANSTILSGDIDSNDTNMDGNYVNESWEDIQGANSYHVVFGSFLDGTVILDGFTITGGQSTGSAHGEIGAGINLNWCNSNVTYANLAVSGNKSGLEGSTNGSGGGIYHPCGIAAFTNIVFTGNFAGNGGGATIGGEAVLTDVLFQENFAEGCGGGLVSYSAESPALLDVDFYRNSAANWGGGLCNPYMNDTILTNVTFNENHAAGGGAMYNAASNPVLTNVAFSGNSADQYGGGAIFSTSGSSPSLTNVTFSGNSASFGGAMLNSTGSPILTNVSFSGNLAVSDGGGMWTNNSNPTLTNVTFSGNSAGEEGGGLYNSNTSNQILTNIILWGNAASLGAGIWNDSSTPQISYSDIQGCGGSGSWNSACGADGGGNIEADPLFVDASTGNLHLQLTSPAIDAGNVASLPPSLLTDLGGYPRFVDIPTIPDTGNGAPPIVDMGAYETQFVDVAVGKAILPPVATPGETITFTLAVSNTGSLPATGIVVSDTLSAWLWGVSFASTLIMTDTGHVPPFIWLVQDLAPGQAGLITVTGMLTVPLAAGTYTNTAFISAADDLLAENNTDVITFTVPNVAPTFTSAPIITATEAAQYTYTLTAQDDNSATLTITASTLPAWLTLTDHGDGAATLSGTPANADVGEHTVVLRVADSGGLTDSQTFTITVWGRIYLPLVLRNTP